MVSLNFRLSSETDATLATAILLLFWKLSRCSTAVAAASLTGSQQRRCCHVAAVTATAPLAPSLLAVAQDSPCTMHTVCTGGKHDNLVVYRIALLTAKLGTPKGVAIILC